MDREALELLRAMEAELLTLHQEAVRVATRAFELHELTCTLLHRELAKPLSA